jgi:hypothetical protein
VRNPQEFCPRQHASGRTVFCSHPPHKVGGNILVRSGDVTGNIKESYDVTRRKHRVIGGWCNMQ